MTSWQRLFLVGGVTACVFVATASRGEPLSGAARSGGKVTVKAPPFSWETVPVFVAFRDQKLLQADAVKKIAADADFICVEKGHGLRDHGDAVIGLAHELKAFRQVNQKAKVLAYFNSALTYPFTRHTHMFTPEEIDRHPDEKAFLLVDEETGELATQFGQYCLNVLNPAMRAWWSDAAADMVKQSGADGILIDQMHGFSWIHGRPQRTAVQAGVADMMRQLKEKLGPDKLFIANNAAQIDAVFEVADGFMFEHYKREVTHTKEKLLQDWQLMKKIAEAGKLCIYRFGAEPEPDTLLAEAGGGNRLGADREEYAALAKRQIEFYLAVYLIGAQPYSYFQWNWAWDLRAGPLERYPELHRPLGSPLGNYTRVSPDAWEFTREFERASVWVDTENWKAHIDWK